MAQWIPACIGTRRLGGTLGWVARYAVNRTGWISALTVDLT